ncbi:TIGR02642 family protein [Enterovibrio sp. 27052020O]|uniref:TIGR02642 family protein n=1 Tax=Enterovibrio sp. 27052020O TaxID=3241166 RepID=UPI00388FCFE2
MNRGIELFIRMHIEKTGTHQQRGRQTLTGDVIIAVLGKLQHDHPIGSDAIMWRWLDDANAQQRLEAAMARYVPSHASRPELCAQIVALAVTVFADKPVVSQQRTLTSLWKNHSEQARRSERLIRTWQAQINVLERQIAGSTVFRAQALAGDIDKKTGLIAKERQRLSDYAASQAAKSCACPRCRGTGVVKVVDACPSCEGAGTLTVTPDNVRQHLRQLGIARVSDAIWSRELKPLFEVISQQLHILHNEAATALEKQLVLERAA